MKKVLAFLLTAIISFTPISFFFGCGESTIDKNKTQLYIGVYNGGLGTAWTKAVAEKFEEYYKDVSFESGKTGVQVVIDAKKDQFLEDTLIPSIKSGVETNDIYYTANQPTKFIAENVTADITDVLNEKIYDENGNLGGNEKSILDRMNENYVKKYDKNGKYFGFPFEDSILQFVYDHDLFVQNGYYSDQPGPSGDPNGWDFGLPATMADLKNLFDKMLTDQITPFVMTGEAWFYTSPMPYALEAQYDGLDQYALNYKYDGYYNSSVDSTINSANGGQGTLITPQNGYLLADQKGKEKAIEFFKFLVSDTRYTKNTSFMYSQSHIQAQKDFVYGRKFGTRYAMILEGEWWENEARELFTEMETTYKDPKLGYGQRDFRYMPFPRMDGQAVDGSVFANFSQGTIAFANSNSTKKEVIAKWIQFALSNESCATFTLNTGAQLPYDYTLTAEQKSSLTKFAANNWDMKRSGNFITTARDKESDYFLYGTLRFGDSVLRSKIGNTEYTGSILMAMYNSPSITAGSYFAGIKEYYSQVAWSSSYSAFSNLYG